jgi:predicted enzyme related to lactoylglutathione lyase
MQPVYHFEMVARDPEKAINFYKNVFGWEFNKVPHVEYWTITTTQSGQQGINGGLTPFVGPPPTPFEPEKEVSRVTNSILVDDLDKVSQKVEAAGGKIIPPKPGTENPYVKICEDPNGIRFGIYKAG